MQITHLKIAWMKIHLMGGVKTNIVTSVKITGRAPYPHLWTR